MLNVKINTTKLIKTLDNTAKYSQGFLEGIDLEKKQFNIKLAEYTKNALQKYIDANARIHPEKLHHVYEWGMVGEEAGRLFELNTKVTKATISITGHFLQSRIPSPTSDQVFEDKANVMENSIAVTIEPKSSDVLAFESEGETVFTRKSITIEHPGGDAVANSFGETVDNFFGGYFQNSLLLPFIEKLKNPKEYSSNFPAGASRGWGPGIEAGKKYMSGSGVVVE